MSSEEIEDFIRNHKWTYAKTMPQSPHWYVVKEKCRDPEEFDFRFVRSGDEVLLEIYEYPTDDRVPSERELVYSFNGPQSLFADTIRSMRALVVAHQLGHVLMGEGDKPINLLHRAIVHAATTARFMPSVPCAWAATRIP